MTEIGASLTEANRKIIRQVFEAWHTGTGVIADVFASDTTKPRMSMPNSA